MKEIFLILSIIIVVSACGYCLLRVASSKKNNNVLAVIAVAVFFASTLIYIPIYTRMFVAEEASTAKVILQSVYMAIKLFIVDGDYSVILEFANQGELIDTVYSVYVAVLFVGAPLLTFGFILSLLKNINARIKMLLFRNRDWYIFSELNAESIILAKSIRDSEIDEISYIFDIVKKEWNQLDIPDSISDFISDCMQYIDASKESKNNEKKDVLLDKLRTINDVEYAKHWLKTNNILTYVDLRRFIKKCIQRYKQKDCENAIDCLENYISTYYEYEQYKRILGIENDMYFQKRDALISYIKNESIVFLQGNIKTAEFENMFLDFKTMWSEDIINLFMGIILEHNREKCEMEKAEELKQTKARKRKGLIFFMEADSEIKDYDELIGSAEELNAVVMKKHVADINLKAHNVSANVYFYFMGENELENMLQANSIIAKYKYLINSNLYLFSNRIESEVITNSVGIVNMKIRRVNPYRSFIENLLYTKGTDIFDKAIGDADSKKIGAIIIGMGKYGTAMFKALSWYLQMNGYVSTIDCFDANRYLGSRLNVECPGLFCEDKENDFQLDINIHSGVNVRGDEFVTQLKELKDTTYVFVALGNDELTTDTAFMIRMLFERMKINPIIQAVSKSRIMNDKLDGITNYKKQAYNIDFLGDLESSYSQEVIMHSKMEEEALQAHMSYGGGPEAEAAFWAYEYNYHSSVATIIHRRAKIHCHIPGMDKTNVKDLTTEENRTIAELEHKRWNAYMRSEGYVYVHGEKRNDMAKIHHLMIPFNELPPKEQEKDIDVCLLAPN